MSRNTDIAKDPGKGGLVKFHGVVSENLEICFNLRRWQYCTPLEKGWNLLGKMEHKTAIGHTPEIILSVQNPRCNRATPL